MARSLLDEFSSLLTPELLGRLSGPTGEGPDAIARGLSAAAPVLLAGVLGKASEPQGARDLLGLLNDPALGPGALGSLGSLFGADRASSPLAALANRFLSSIFGGNTSGVADALRQPSGLQASSISALLPAVAALVMSLLAGKVRSQGLNAQGLTSLLLGQKESILSALPSGLGSVLNLQRLRGLGTATAGAATAAAGSARRSLWPIAAVLALLVGGFWLFNMLSSRRAAVDPLASTLPPVGAQTPSVAMFKRTLPTGYVLNVPETGIERQLVVFLADSERPLGTDIWFDFDRLLFETGSATLKPESRAQLRDVAAILAAYPTARVKISGYTDNTGSADANVALSQARAASVVSELVALGIGADRLAAEGYGDQHPVASNATEEGRAQNRRIALQVTAR